jgi:predicted GH43/DUF377 family glycosyl hydrolase
LKEFIAMPELTKQAIPQRLAHNRALMDKFLKARGIVSQFPPVEQQLESIIVKGLPPGSYNPSIIRHRGKLVMAYRFHETTAKTKLGIAELDENFTVVRNETLNLDEDEGLSLEDAKLFEFKGELWMNFVVSNWPNFPASQVKCVKLYKPDHWRCSDKDLYWLPCRQTMEKNHCPLVHDEVLNIVYRHNWQMDDGVWQVVFTPSDKREMKTPGMRWPYGEIRGGTPPLPYQDRLISFFHSRLNNEMPPVGHRYYMGALLMKSGKEFEMLAVSKRPILRGSEIGGDTSRFHFKPNVVIPYGAIEHEGGWLVSVGVNDSQCLLMKVKPENLNL